MAIQSFQLDPAAGGVSQATFDAHTHNYRKLTQVVGDDDDGWSTKVSIDVVDDAEVYLNAGGGNPPDLEAIGVVVATAPTGTPA